MRLLDTSAVVDLLRRRTYEPGRIASITLIEVLRGVPREKRAEVKQLLEESFEPIGLDNQAILTYCSIHEALRERGEAIPDADLLIAATAMSRGLTLKTGDRHFRRLEELGLKIEA